MILHPYTVPILLGPREPGKRIRVLAPNKSAAVMVASHLAHRAWAGEVDPGRIVVREVPTPKERMVLLAVARSGWGLPAHPLDGVTPTRRSEPSAPSSESTPVPAAKPTLRSVPASRDEVVAAASSVAPTLGLRAHPTDPGTAGERYGRRYRSGGAPMAPAGPDALQGDDVA
jgi:hypothetical protein